MVDRFSSMHQNNQGTLTTNEVDEQLEKGIDCEGLAEFRK
jgi:hypothetical protein